MKERTYQGWHRQDTRFVIYFADSQVFDLISVCESDLGTTPGLVSWGERGPGAETLARLLLWHATWDSAVVEDLAPMYHDLVVSRLPATWEIDRETVRDWVQSYQSYRALLHGRSPWQNCPGCT